MAQKSVIGTAIDMKGEERTHMSRVCTGKLMTGTDIGRKQLITEVKMATPAEKSAESDVDGDVEKKRPWKGKEKNGIQEMRSFKGGHLMCRMMMTETLKTKSKGIEIIATNTTKAENGARVMGLLATRLLM